jgi:hypothetical protein
MADTAVLGTQQGSRAQPPGLHEVMAGLKHCWEVAQGHAPALLEQGQEHAVPGIIAVGSLVDCEQCTGSVDYQLILQHLVWKSLLVLTHVVLCDPGRHVSGPCTAP